jgi:hypothetical protein
VMETFTEPDPAERRARCTISVGPDLSKGGECRIRNAVRR